MYLSCLSMTVALLVRGIYFNAPFVGWLLGLIFSSIALVIFIKARP